MTRFVTVMPTWAADSWVERDRRADWRPVRRPSPVLGLVVDSRTIDGDEPNSAATKAPQATISSRAAPISRSSITERAPPSRRAAVPVGLAARVVVHGRPGGRAPEVTTAAAAGRSSAGVSPCGGAADRTDSTVARQHVLEDGDDRSPARALLRGRGRGR